MNIDDHAAWADGRFVWPTNQAGEPDGQRFNITSIDELSAFLPIAADSDYWLLPSELLALIEQAAKLGVFVKVPDLPTDGRYAADRLLPDGDVRPYRRSVLNTLELISVGLKNATEIPLPPHRRDEWEKTLEVLTPRQREIAVYILKKKRISDQAVADAFETSLDTMRRQLCLIRNKLIEAKTPWQLYRSQERNPTMNELKRTGE